MYFNIRIWGMLYLQSWDDDLAEMASLWAEHCHWEHGQPNYANPPYDPIGQNLYITSSSTLNIENALQVV